VPSGGGAEHAIFIPCPEKVRLDGGGPVVELALESSTSLLVEGNGICTVYVQLIRYHLDDRSMVMKVDQERWRVANNQVVPQNIASLK